MIIHKQTKALETQSHRPAENWMGKNYYMVPDGSERAQKIIVSYPYFEFVVEDSELVNITPTERPPEPEPEPDPLDILVNQVGELAVKVAYQDTIIDAMLDVIDDSQDRLALAQEMGAERRVV